MIYPLKLIHIHPSIHKLLLTGKDFQRPHLGSRVKTYNKLKDLDKKEDDFVSL